MMFPLVSPLSSLTDVGRFMTGSEKILESAGGEGGGPLLIFSLHSDEQ